MSHSDPTEYQRSTPDRLGQGKAIEEELQSDAAAVTRRHFLEAAGFTMSLTAITGCGRAPTEVALPFVVQPEGVVPGRMQQYAATCAGCSAGCGLLVGVRDGRPLKMEGMPEHPLSRGGLCAIGQALPLGLYDSQRLKRPLARGQETDWETIDKEIVAALDSQAQQGVVAVVTPTISSPSLLAGIDVFLSRFPNSRHVVFDSVSSSAILEAHHQSHGARVLPRFRFDRAKVILSLGADFLGTWISPVEFTAAWRSQRSPTQEHPEMSYHVQMEGRLSLTGSNADRRYQVAPDEYAALLSHLAHRIGQRANLPSPYDEPSTKCPIPPADLAHLSDRLWDARGTSLIVCDSQEIFHQVLVNYLNSALENYGQTIDLSHPSQQRLGNDVEVARLLEDLRSGKVAALFVAGTDLTHNLPDRTTLGRAISEVPLVVSFAERVDDFATLAHYVCPDHHPLESWMDAEPVRGIVSLSQPTIRPLGETRSILESFHRWSGGTDSAYELVNTHWRDHVYPRAKLTTPFQAFWDRAVHDGFVEIDSEPSRTSAVQFDNVTIQQSDAPADSLTLTLYTKVALTDSRHAHNPWLQELPDPVSKVTWDNYIALSQATATRYGLTTGDLARLNDPSGLSIELPVMVQPGQHDRVLAVALAYGVPGTDRFATLGPHWLEGRPTVAEDELVGKNAAPFLEFRDGSLQFTRTNVTLEKLSGRRPLASTDGHHSLEVPPSVAPEGAEVRDIIQRTTLPEFRDDPRAGTPTVHHHGDTQLWAEDHPKTEHHWGMAVDLNRCTGCSACLIACQSENNVPVVGKDEVLRGREMHWIRVDRYYSGPSDDLDVAHQPMMCQHCDNAPCETVCPVLATIHGKGGLNQQAYNRCVGTRYCANNCPYKVRRFNWFTYEHHDAVRNLALNPDVTVRTRGVMEKCSMCVQRIEDGKLEARRMGQPLEDGAIQTACQQSCPAQAIVFGDMNDPNSHVSQALEDPRRFGVLEEFNFRPSVSYLRMVTNRDAPHSEEQSQERDAHA